jgi:SprT-like family protein
MPPRPLPGAVQLTLDFAALPTLRTLTSEQFIRELRGRRARLKHVRFKDNRSRIIALGKDGCTLHIHSCFRNAPDEVLDAVAVFLKAGRRSEALRAAINELREFWQTQGENAGWLQDEDASLIESVKKLPCAGTREQLAFLREAYTRYNLLHFENKLPHDVPIRISERMASRFGHMRYHVTRSGERMVLEVAINHDLFMPGNESNLLDTLLHEMTHIEAWLLHAHRGHGAAWKNVARRVGCEPLACSGRIIRRRRRNGAVLVATPDASWLPVIAQQGAA